MPNKKLPWFQQSSEPIESCYMKLNLKKKLWGAWVARSAKRPTLAQVMISQFLSSSSTSGSGLTAQSLEPAMDSVFLSLCPSPAHALSLSVSKINKH